MIQTMAKQEQLTNLDIREEIASIGMHDDPVWVRFNGRLYPAVELRRRSLDWSRPGGTIVIVDEEAVENP